MPSWRASGPRCCATRHAYAAELDPAEVAENVNALQRAVAMTEPAVAELLRPLSGQQREQ